MRQFVLPHFLKVFVVETVIAAVITLWTEKLVCTMKCIFFGIYAFADKIRKAGYIRVLDEQLRRYYFTT